MRSRIVPIQFLAVVGTATALSFAVTDAGAFSGGIGGRAAAGCGGAGCHGSVASSSASVTLDVPALVAHGANVDVTVTIADSTVPATGPRQGGFDLLASAGEFGTPAGGSRFSAVEVGHGVASNAQRSWTVAWTPGTNASTCEFTFQVAANAVDGNFAPGPEDHWNLASASARIDAASDAVAPHQVSFFDPRPGRFYVNDQANAHNLQLPVVVGGITLRIVALDNVGIERVELFDSDLLDEEGSSIGEAVYDPSTTTFTMFWDTTGEPPGPHTLRARAEDCGGNTTEGVQDILLF